MATKRLTVKSYLTEKEFETVLANSTKAGLSMSKFIRRVATGQTVPSVIDSQAILALLADNADLARLGGLFKIALDSRSLQPELRRLLREIEKTRLEIKEKVREINDGKRH